MAVKNNSNKIWVIIPSLNPDKRLVELVESLTESIDFSDICQAVLIVNDGSAAEYDTFFNEAEQKYGCTILTHAANQGKGRALKTAFNYILCQSSHGMTPNCVGAVTVDSDGQHKIDDILKCAQALIESPEKLVLGCRDFDSDSVPFKSLFGNKLTRWITKFLCGIDISDTQTGLRAIPCDFIEKLLTVPGERFEFEMNMLIQSKRFGFDVKEVPIKTIYLEENKSSHFNPVVDSLLIYKLFFKFALSAMASFAVDFVVFSIFIYLLKNVIPVSYILVSTVVARVISSVFNYLVNLHVVFQGSTDKSNLFRYYALAVTQMMASGLLVSFLFLASPFGEKTVKIFVDTVLFLFSYRIQHNWVFRKR